MSNPFTLSSPYRPMIPLYTCHSAQTAGPNKPITKPVRRPPSGLLAERAYERPEHDSGEGQRESQEPNEALRLLYRYQFLHFVHVRS